MAEILNNATRRQADRLVTYARMQSRQKIGMVLVLSLIIMVSLPLVECRFLTHAAAPAQQPSIRFVRTVQVTPDEQFLTGSFARINYVPATDRLVVSFGTEASLEQNASAGAGYAYKEYNLEMQETGSTGVLEWYGNSGMAGDSGSVMVNSTYYCAFVSQNIDDPYGWRIVKYDASSMTRLKEIYVTLSEPTEGNTDPMVAYVNGKLDVSGQCSPSGIWQLGNWTRHHFFTADLEPLGNITLDDTPHICGSSIVYVDGIYYYVSANSYVGGLTLMRYDSDWNFLGNKSLIPNAHWSQGTVFDGERFYVAYLDTSARSSPTFFPVYPNVHLAVFDRDWNLTHDLLITDFVYGGDKKAGRPWVILHGSSLYVSYDVDTVNVTTQEEDLRWQAYVTIFEISQTTQDGLLSWPILIVILVLAVVAVAYRILRGLRHA